MVIALSGKCCSGKNYISSIFESRGFKIIDVDILAGEIFSKLDNQILKIFGNTVLVNGRVDKKRVGDLLFKDKEKREELEGIIHPLVYDRIIEIIGDKGDYIINIPLLKPSILVDYLDYIVWIKSPLLLRLYRAKHRDNYTFITLVRRIWAQKKLSVKYFITTVDIYYIYNSWFTKGLDKQVSSILNKL
ncbi:dephospho-CoA kinase [Thiospirochaeta perfilievii]|uniref:Dephospho-CoA kinase n=1 Tax=Thiospirochaeta perfilievii TaxID=252967 RepID=A0A5C1QGG4_9SPIO|nr:dephospho-CoA kinase [Thiospirochaeta perfilievii]QEN05704.1 dephospho-CoA kinase [Thiospirochaeta perfilievii]